jgi:hypothetical protein
MENKSGSIESLFEKMEIYGKTTFELFKLKAVDKTVNAVSTTVSYAVVALLFFISILIVSIGVAFWLGELLGKTYYGFFCVAGFYCVLGLVLYLGKNIWIKRGVSNLIITHALN